MRNDSVLGWIINAIAVGVLALLSWYSLGWR